MKRSPIVLLVLLVLLPLALLGWAGVRLAQHQQWQAEQRIRDLLTGQLQEDDRSVASSFATLAAELQELTALDHYDAEAIRDLTRNDPRLFQVFVIDPADVLIHPNPDGPLLRTEREFILRAAEIINDRKLQRIAESKAGNTNPGKKIKQPARDVRTGLAPQTDTSASSEASGWFSWYWGPGLNLIYWQRRSSGHIVGVALERSRWIADLIAGLPDTPALTVTDEAPSTQLRIRLVEAGGETLYEWGRFVPPESGTPTGQIPLSEPLESWQLQIFAPLPALTRSAGDGAYWNLLAGLIIAGVALTVLAVIFYQQYSRDMRDAGQRVSFVNQVSHELRTPLTNIRLYAELIDSDLEKLPEPPVEPRRRIGVIVAESGRLSRLIDNVLTFARQERQTLRLSPRECVTDEVIRNVTSRFQGSLDHLEIETELDLQATEAHLADPDALEQILENLISNVEKYAASGQRMEIASRQTPGRVVITVTDHGPGIAAAHREQVFEPFWRASHDVNQVAGTGIGLAIARHLARLHGGDLTLQCSDSGTTFQLELQTPPPSEHRS